MSCPNPNGRYLISDGRLTDMRSVGASIVIPVFTLAGACTFVDTEVPTSFTTTGDCVADQSEEPVADQGFTSTGDMTNLGSTVV